MLHVPSAPARQREGKREYFQHAIHPIPLSACESNITCWCSFKMEIFIKWESKTNKSIRKAGDVLKSSNPPIESRWKKKKMDVKMNSRRKEDIGSFSWAPFWFFSTFIFCFILCRLSFFFRCQQHFTPHFHCRLLKIYVSTFSTHWKKNSADFPERFDNFSLALCCASRALTW